MWFKKIILKDFHDFHKYNVGDKVLVNWEGYDKLERVATIKSVHISFVDGEIGKMTPHYKQSLYYYFKEFDGWLSEDKIISKLK